VLIAAIVVPGLVQDPIVAPTPGPAELDEVVVLGQRTTPDPFEIFQAVCLDANRLDKRSFRPDGVPRWARLEADGSAPAESFIRRDGDLEMVLRIEEGPDDTVERAQRNVCSLTLAGPHDQQSLTRGMANAMGGAGTARHLDLPGIYPTYAGWTQLLWSAMPNKDSSRWRVFMPERGRESGVLLVARPSFYREYSYVVTELRFTDQTERPVSHIALTYITRASQN